MRERKSMTPMTATPKKLTPMMQQYFEVNPQIFSPMFRSLFAEFFQSESDHFRSVDVRQNAPIFGRWV